MMGKLSCIDDAITLSEKYGMPLSEILFCELNRVGIYLESGRVPVSFRARFLCDEIFSPKPPMYFAVSVKEKRQTNFSIGLDDNLRLGPVVLGRTCCLEIDTCDCSYFRKNKKILNLNSNQRGQCGGCIFCIHNYDLYDERVLKDKQKIRGREAIQQFLENKIMARNGLRDLGNLEQIAVVTGLFGNEKTVVQHICDIREVAGNLGFTGTIFFLGFELMSEDALKQLGQFGPISICHSIDCFTKRKERLVGRKAKLTLESIIESMEKSLELSMEITFSLIVGLDSLEDLTTNIYKIRQFVNRFPIINIYQTQHESQKNIMIPEAKDIEFFLAARKLFESAFYSMRLKPNNWENYRSLWYHYFADIYIPE